MYSLKFEGMWEKSNGYLPLIQRGLKAQWSNHVNRVCKDHGVRYLRKRREQTLSHIHLFSPQKMYKITSEAPVGPCKDSRKLVHS